MTAPPTPSAPSAPRQPPAVAPRRRRGTLAGRCRRASLALLGAAAALLSFPGAVGPARQVSPPLAVSLFQVGGRPKVLYKYKDYELLFRPRKKGQYLPRLQLRKTPPRPVTVAGAEAGVEGPLDRDFAGFPFTTGNSGAIQIGFPRWGGRLKLGLQDPPTGAVSSLDDEEPAQTAGEATYEQPLPGFGDVSLRAKNTGEWAASFAREVEDLGRLSGTVNSQLDWNLDLESSYPPYKGFVPSAMYGATQDGMRVRASVEGPLVKNLHGSYSVQNEAGQYAPTDLQHEAKLTLTSGSGRHVLTAQGSYDRKLPQVPVRGSLAYSTQLKPVTFDASVDFDQFRLSAKAGPGEVAAALARKAEAGNRPAEVEVKLGKASATALLGRGEKPRLRLGVAL